MIPHTLRRESLLLDYVATRFRRSRLKWTGFFLLFTLITFFYGSLFFFSDLLQANADTWLNNAPDLVVQLQRGGRQRDLPRTMAAPIDNIRGVASVTPRLWGYYFDPGTRTAWTVIAPPGVLQPGEAIIGGGIARLWQIAAGDILAVNDAGGNPLTFHIKELFPADSDMATADLFQLGEADFRTLFQLPADEATDLAVMVPRSEERANVASKIKELFPTARVVVNNDLRDTLAMIFGWRSAIFLIISLVGLLALLIFAIDQLSGLWSGERRETALLRTLGWPTALIVRARLYEVGAVALTAWLAGSILAWVHIYWMGGGLVSAALRGWSSIFPVGGFAPLFRVQSVLLLFTITVLPLLTVSLIPIWRLAKIDPEALK